MVHRNFDLQDKIEQQANLIDCDKIQFENLFINSDI